MPVLNLPEFKYCARYCEENIWHLVQEPVFSDAQPVVAVISNKSRACLFWSQRVSEHADLPVWWDYHVILLARKSSWHAYDLDSTMPAPVRASTYLNRTFRHQDRLPANSLPRFLLFDGPDYVREFASDRSHMRDAEAGWLAPPPDWPPIREDEGVSFPRSIDRGLSASSDVSLAEMHRRFGV